MVLIPTAQETCLSDLPKVPKFWPDGFLSDLVILETQPGYWLCLMSSIPKLKFIPEDTINQELEALESQNLWILFSGIDYVKRE